MSGVLSNPPSRLNVMDLGTITGNVTVVSLNGAGAIFANPSGGARTLNIVPQESGTKIDVVNTYAAAANLLVTYGAAPYTTMTLNNQIAVSLISIDGVWCRYNGTQVVV
jgi:hypothetical protein